MAQGVREQAIVARHSSTCDLCSTRIHKDVDDIVCVEGEWVHAQCAEDHELEVEEIRSPAAHYERPDWWDN